jgi:NosR/NirI family nitrous oxide reductase transcriptional regulator
LGTRIDWHEVSRRAGLPFLAFVVVTWAGAWHRGAQRPEPDLYPFMKKAWPRADYEPTAGGGFAVKRDGQLIGYAMSGTASGYSGPITMAVGASPEGRLRSLALLEYRDTPDLMRRSRALLQSLLGKSQDDSFEIGKDVDAVSGATASSRGIALASMAAAQAIADRGILRVRAAAGVTFGAPEACLFALLAISAVGRNRRSLSARTRRILRVSTLLGSLITIGFLFARPWTISFPIRLLSGDWPPWPTHLYWYVLLAGVLLVWNRNGKNPYCPWVCPFGAAQDVIGLASGASKRRMPSTVLFTWVKRILLWSAVFLGLLYRSPGATSYEVFAALFRRSGSAFQFAILAFTVAAATFVSRPFCNWVCPVDAIEQFARVARRRLLRILGGAESTSRQRRPVRLPMVAAEAPVASIARRLRNGLLTGTGLLCALLVLGHFYSRLAQQSEGAQENLMGQTFVSVDAP